ncbi:MAG: CPBP family intramembrane glutamic endopeptidase [Cyclobacteriaceae bacterium]
MDRKILWLGLLTLLGFGFSGLALVYFFQDTSAMKLFSKGWFWGWQIFVGLISGGFSSVIAIWIIKRPFFENRRRYYHRLINLWEWDQRKILFVSLCAGIGEELFFRAGLQPLLGLWTTAVLFVVLHGYLHPYDWKISVYGLIMVFIIAGFGFIFQKTGIISVITAHAIFDWILLSWMTTKTNKFLYGICHFRSI